MKKNLLCILSTAFLALLLPVFVSAQDAKTISSAGSIYLISAKAGGVSYIEGSVSVSRKDGKGGQLLKNDSVEVGDKIATSDNGKAEILLNPGSFIRLANNAKFEFVTTNLDDLKLRLTSGSAMLEVYADNAFKVTVSTPKSEVVLTKTGVYRIDVAADGSGFVSVWRGKIVLPGKVEVKEGRTLALGETTAAAVTKFDRDNKDELTIWSQLRAKEAVKVNEKLQGRALRTSLLNAYNNRLFNSYTSLGVWAFDASRARWCFVPFGYGWASPYGMWYNYDMWSLGMPYYVYTGYNGYPGPPANNGGGNGNGTGGGTVVGNGGGVTITDRKSDPNNPPDGVILPPSGRPTWQQFEINQGIGTRGGRLDPGRLDPPMGGGPTYDSGNGGAVRGGGGTVNPGPTMGPTQSNPPPQMMPPSPRRVDPKDN